MIYDNHLKHKNPENKNKKPTMCGRKKTRLLTEKELYEAQSYGVEVNKASV